MYSDSVYKTSARFNKELKKSLKKAIAAYQRGDYLLWDIYYFDSLYFLSKIKNQDQIYTATKRILRLRTLAKSKGFL